jgi:hypothetical protein
LLERPVSNIGSAVGRAPADSVASLVIRLRRGHICRRWVEHCEPASGLPPSETVKLRTVSRAKYLQGVSAVSASDLPVTGHSKTSFPSIPAFSAISATRFDCRRRRVADTAGRPGTPARRPAHPPRAGDLVGFEPSTGLTWRQSFCRARGKSYRELKYKSSNNLARL